MRRSIRLGRACALALPLLLLLPTSCGVREERLPETGATLEGVITYNGEPVQFAMILVRTENASASGRIGEDGRYKVENAPLGEVTVGVDTNAGQGEYTSKMMNAANKGPGVKYKGKVIGVKFTPIPKKYHDPGTSGFKTTVAKGPNTYDIDVPK
jgi:hypothetical protein